MKEILRKFTSRKFLAMVTSIVVAVMVYLGADENTTEQVVSLIGLFGSVVTYIFVEGAVDKGTKKPTVEETVSPPTEGYETLLEDE